MKHLSAVLLLFVLSVAMFAALPVSANNYVDGCEAFNTPSWDGYYHTATRGGAPKEFQAGDAILLQSSANDAMVLKLSGNVVASGSNPLVYTFAADTVVSPIEYGTASKINGDVEVSCVRGYTPADDPQDTMDTDSANDANESNAQYIAPPCNAVLDGRINNNPQIDCSAPIAVYTAEATTVYVINPQTGAGNLVASVAQTNLPTAAPETNLTLAQGVNPYNGTPVIVSLLTTGEIQVNAFYADWKPYTIAWPANAPQSFYHIAW